MSNAFAAGNDPGSGLSGDFSNTASKHFNLTWLELTNYTDLTYLKQATQQAMAAGVTYTLSYFLGGRLDAVSIGFVDVMASLYDTTTNSILCSQTTTQGSVSVGSMSQYALAYTVPAGSPSIGHHIGLRFDSVGSASYAWSQTAIDTVTLLKSVSPPKAFYVDATHGNDAWDGLSGTYTSGNHGPWQTIGKVNSACSGSVVRGGDSVLFARGEVWRGQLLPMSGDPSGRILFSAYGSTALPKPQLLGSSERNNISDWQNLGGNVWSTLSGSPLNVDVGNIIFKNGESCGLKRWVLTDQGSPPDFVHTGLHNQGDFFYDASNKTVKVYSMANPASLYSDIELALDGNIIQLPNQNYLTFESLDLRYGDYGIAMGGSHDVTVRDCDISFIGGALFGYEGSGTPVRSGNGIDMYGDLYNILIEDNRIWDIYDAGVTHQGVGGFSEHHITIRNNVIWKCEFSYEYYLRSGSIISNIYFENNTCAYAGLGWADGQRTNGENGRNLMFWAQPEGVSVSDFFVRNNIFCESDESGAWIRDPWNGIQNLTLDYNLYYESDGPFTCYLDRSYQSWEFALYQSESGKDAHSVLASPQFVDPLNGDFHLQGSSPAIDAGVNTGSGSDCSGTARPQGIGYDIGAYEYINQLNAVQVQNGLAERSFVRYVDLFFTRAGGLADLLASGRVALTRYELDGSGGSQVALDSAMRIRGNRLALDFGVQGIGGNRNTSLGDGYYDLALDLDGNGSLETHRCFYRLLGDMNGDRVVDALDAHLILAAYGRTGSSLNDDVNGDGVISALDRTLAIRSLGRKLKGSLAVNT
jgi:hypothetical protein